MAVVFNRGGNAKAWVQGPFKAYEARCDGVYSANGDYICKEAQTAAMNAELSTTTEAAFNHEVDHAIYLAPSVFSIWEDDTPNIPDSWQFAWLKAALSMVPRLTDHMRQQQREKLRKLMFLAVFAGGQTTTSDKKKILFAGESKLW